VTHGGPVPPPRAAVPFAELAAAVAQAVDAHAFPDDPPVVFIPTDRPVARLGFALQPAPGLAAWAVSERLDAIFLHRPWGVEDAGLPGGVGVLASHHGFDARLTIGAHPRFAHALQMHDVEPFGAPGDAPGLTGRATITDAALVLARIREIFGGVEEVIPGGAANIHRIAIVNAMNDARVRQAAALGADLYVTGQIRHPARNALAETGMAAIGIGHRRSEEYALRTLAGALAEAFPARLATVIHPGGAVPA
jgi:putative NIF3 family GTP cyclohydrolase 1 type 2